MFCKHGTYVGDPHGADHMCGYCEDGTEPQDAEPTPFDVVESHPVFASLSPEARYTIARNEMIRREGL